MNKYPGNLKSREQTKNKKNRVYLLYLKMEGQSTDQNEQSSPLSPAILRGLGDRSYDKSLTKFERNRKKHLNFWGMPILLCPFFKGRLQALGSNRLGLK